MCSSSVQSKYSLASFDYSLYGTPIRSIGGKGNCINKAVAVPVNKANIKEEQPVPHLVSDCTSDRRDANTAAIVNNNKTLCIHAYRIVSHEWFLARFGRFKYSQPESFLYYLFINSCVRR